MGLPSIDSKSVHLMTISTLQSTTMLNVEYICATSKFNSKNFLKTFLTYCKQSGCSVENGIESTSAPVFIYPKGPDVVSARVGVQRVLLLPMPFLVHRPLAPPLSRYSLGYISSMKCRACHHLQFRLRKDNKYLVFLHRIKLSSLFDKLRLPPDSHIVNQHKPMKNPKQRN